MLGTWIVLIVSLIVFFALVSYKPGKSIFSK